MWIGLVIVLAAAVGGGVYLVSLRSLEGTKAGAHAEPTMPTSGGSRSVGASAAPASGLAPPPPPAAALPAAAGTVYVPLALDERPPLATRFVRLLGLVALVCVAGLILAFSIWQAVAVIGDLLRHYLGS